jgi:FMN-dependent NADH-azoreductase
LPSLSHIYSKNLGKSAVIERLLTILFGGVAAVKRLHIIATPRGENSRTLSISRKFLDGFRARHPGVEIGELDLSNVDLPPYTGNTADAKYILMAGEALDEATQEAWERITATMTHFLSAGPSPMPPSPWQLAHSVL